MSRIFGAPASGPARSNSKCQHAVPKAGADDENAVDVSAFGHLEIYD